MIRLLSMAAAVTLFVQDGPELPLQKIHKELSGARTIRIVIEGKGEEKSKDRTEAFDISCTLLMKAGNKARANLFLTEPGKKDHLEDESFLSDGARCGRLRKGKVVNVRPVWKSFNADVIDILVRVSALPTTQITRVDGEPKRDWLPGMSDFKAGAKDGELETVTWRFAFDDHKGLVKLWWDPKTGKPARRTVDCDPTKSGSVMKWTETIKEWTIDGEIDDSEFKMAEDK